MQGQGQPSNPGIKHSWALCQGFPCSRATPGSPPCGGDTTEMLKGFNLVGNSFGVNKEGVVGAAVGCRELGGPVLLPSRSGVDRGAGRSRDLALPHPVCERSWHGCVLVEGQESPPRAALPTPGAAAGVFLSRALPPPPQEGRLWKLNELLP